MSTPKITTISTLTQGDLTDINNVKQNGLMFKLLSIPGIGLILGTLSGIFLATGSLTVKLVQSLSGVEVAIARSLVQAILTGFIILFVTRDSILSTRDERWPLIIRSVTGCLALLTSFSAIKLIPLADSQSIVFSSPVFVNILGCLLLKEPCGGVQIFAVLAAIVGIFLISRPSFIFGSNFVGSVSSHDRTLGLILAILSCFSASGTFICMRRLPKTPAAVVVFWYSTFCVVVGLIVSIANSTLALPESLTDYGLLLLCGLAGLLGQTTLTLALKVEHAGPVSLARSVEILMSFLYQTTILHEVVSVTSLVGAIILGVGVIAVGLHKWYIGDPERFNRIFCCKKSSNNN